MMSETQMSNNNLLEVRGLKTYFFLDEGTVRAVEGADFEIKRGHTLGIVGESGCGKSVTAQSILQIVPSPGRIVEGEIFLHSKIWNAENNGETTETVELTALDPKGKEMRSIRGSEIAMVFQEPMTSLSPVHSIGNQITEAILLHQDVSKEDAKDKAINMLKRVGMPQPSQTIDNYPHQLSGGMRQRVMIAMALSCHPSLLIADEPTTALDVTTEAQILDLMRGLQDDLGMAIMYITHDLGVIAEMADEVAVMYLGKVVERAEVDTLYYNPLHPYTKALLRSIPRIGRKERLESIKGMVPDPYSRPKGCPFNPRCPERGGPECRTEGPPWIEVEPGHWIRCHKGLELKSRQSG